MNKIIPLFEQFASILNRETDNRSRNFAAVNNFGYLLIKDWIYTV